MEFTFARASLIVINTTSNSATSTPYVERYRYNTSVISPVRLEGRGGKPTFLSVYVSCPSAAACSSTSAMFDGKAVVVAINYGAGHVAECRDLG